MRRTMQIELQRIIKNKIFKALETITERLGIMKISAVQKQRLN